MNWDYCIIAAAIAVALAYLIRRRVLRKYARNACGASSSDCACCRQSSLKAQGVRQ